MNFLQHVELTWAKSASELFWLIRPVRLSVFTLFAFLTSSQSILSQFQPNLALGILVWRKHQVEKDEGSRPLKSGTLGFNEKLLAFYNKKIFSKTIWPENHNCCGSIIRSWRFKFVQIMIPDDKELGQGFVGGWGGGWIFT